MNNHVPKVSIVTPSFNQGQFLEQTILSVLGQNWPNLEYIIVDGGSSDNSIEIIKKYQKHLKYWVSEPDKGQSNAINKGFSYANGTILGWLNSDDLYMPGILNHVCSSIQNDIGIYFGESIRFRERGDSVECWNSNVLSSHMNADLSIVDYIMQPSTFWTRETWEKVGPLLENLHYAFDWEWYLRAKKEMIPFMTLKKAVSLYRIHDAHKTSSGGGARQEEIFHIYESYNPRIAVLFNKLRNEEHYSKKFIFRLLKKIARKRISESLPGEFLKTIKPSKYSGYSVDEINQVMKMM